MLRFNIKTKVSSPHFESITDVIYKSKEKLFKKVKQHQVRKFKHLQESPTHWNTPAPQHIFKKWAINLASKDLSPGEVKLLQRGPKFAVSTPKVPVTEYIAVTKQICDRLAENTDGVDCSEYYQKTKDLLQDYKGKHASHPNISKMEREAIKTLKEDNTCVVLTADKGVAMVIMDKSSYIDKCIALFRTPMSTSLTGISLAKFTDKSRQLFASSRENMGKITNGFSYNTNNCSPQVIPVHQQDFMVYQKYIRQIAQCVL